MSTQTIDTIQPLSEPVVKLDGLFGHLSSCSGLYSKETFMSLYGCLSRMIREQRMQGFVLTRTAGDEAFHSLSLSLSDLSDISLFRFDDDVMLPKDCGLSDDTGFVIVLTDRLCAAVYWSADARKTYRMYDGGWTFHPGHTKTIATQVVDYVSDLNVYAMLNNLLDETLIDRRYDDKLDAMITSLVNGLENRNRQLNIALEANNELNQKMLESERLAAIGQLCSVIAHEIRNPLGLVDLYAKLIEAQLEQMPVEDVTQKEALEKNLSQIRQATEGMETILSELSNYAKPLRLELQPVNIIDFVSDICEFYKPKYDESNVQLILEPPKIDEGSENIEMDKGKIRQALINLLKNALEASGPNTTVTVSLAQRQNENNVWIKVRDEGSGVDEHVRPKLFTPYFSTKGNGTGLGLPHSRKILQAHGGNVDLLKSIPGEGSTFAIVLPQSRPSSAE